MRKNLLSVEIRLESNVEVFENDLRKLLDPVPDDSSTPTSTAAFKLEHNNNRYLLSRDQQILLDTDCYPYLLAHTEYEIYAEVQQKAQRHLLFHAAACANDKHTIIFPGFKGSGKTTLSAYLVTRGYKFFTDEIAAIDLSTGRLVPFPRPFNIKDPSRQMLEPFNSNGSLVFLEYQDAAAGYSRLWALPQKNVTASNPRRVTLIVFPAYKPNCKGSFAPVKPAKAVLDITSRSFNFSNFVKDGFDIVTRLAETAPAYNIEYDSIEEAKALLDNIQGVNDPDGQ